ncbi:serine/threonine-protein kinase [Streptomyces sp. NPDC085946]|uniref:serine/threonine-protein kinase n=1 Tax=Streptomyces sp. NPDC085946 TaxID=3365744 RepID=UPI0037CE70F3
MQGLLVAGRYRLGDAIGSGGMGRVWRAHDEVLHRAVAIKELTAALYVSESEQAVLLARTRAEARAAARINHSAVVTVHDVLEHDGRPWIVMELVEGRSLADQVREQGRVAPREAARVGLWVLRALRAAHTAGVLHRDVKPGNVLLGRDGRVLLTDFGIAQIDGDTTITRTGEVVGSVDYLAPERVRGQDPGPASDLWALGATLYTAVEGRSPFRRTTPLATMQAVVEEEAGRLEHAGPLGPVITALLRKDPAARPGAAEAERMLAGAAEGRRPDAAGAYAPTTRYGSDHHRDAPGGPARPGPGAGAAYPAAYAAGASANDGPASGGSFSGSSFSSGSVPGGAVPGGATSGRPTAGSTATGPGASRFTAPTATGPGATGHRPAGPSATGPTAIGPTAMGPAAMGTAAATAPAAMGPAHPAAGGGSVRRRLRTLALVVVLAALVGGGTAVALLKWDEGRRQDSHVDGSSAPTPTPTASRSRGGAVPDGWVRHDDPVGFSLSLPKGWERRVHDIQDDLRQIDYTPDGGEHFVRIAVDTSPDFADPYAHQLDLEQQLQRLVDYRRVTLERTVYRDRDSARWEYTWTAQAKDTAFPGPRRAVDETYVARDGTEYAIYMSSPAADWPTAREQFASVLRSWQEKTP